MSSEVPSNPTIRRFCDSMMIIPGYLPTAQQLQGNLALPQLPNVDSGMSGRANKLRNQGDGKVAVGCKKCSRSNGGENKSKRKVGKISLLLSAKQPLNYLYCIISTAHLIILNKAFRLLSL